MFTTCKVAWMLSFSVNSYKLVCSVCIVAFMFSLFCLFVNVFVCWGKRGTEVQWMWSAFKGRKLWLRYEKRLQKQQLLTVVASGCAHLLCPFSPLSTIQQQYRVPGWWPTSKQLFVIISTHTRTHTCTCVHTHTLSHEHYKQIKQNHKEFRWCLQAIDLRQSSWFQVEILNTEEPTQISHVPLIVTPPLPIPSDPLTHKSFQGCQHGLGEVFCLFTTGKIETINLAIVPPLVKSWGGLIVLQPFQDGTVYHHLKQHVWYLLTMCYGTDCVCECK